MLKNIHIGTFVRLIAVMALMSGFESCRFILRDFNPDRSLEITISNESNEPVYVRYCLDGQWIYLPFNEYVFIAPGESYTKKSVISDDCVYQWLILKEETYEKYTEKELLDGAIFDDLIEYKYKRLKRMDFKVVYPVVYP